MSFSNGCSEPVSCEWPLAAAASKQAQLPVVRALPTPCRSNQPHAVELAGAKQAADVADLTELTTLLSLSDPALRSQLIADVVLLLEAEPVLPSAAVMTLSLQHSLPVSAPQQQVLRLEDILADRSACQSPLPEDWLDADLSSVHCSAETTDVLRSRLSEIRTTHDAPFPPGLSRIVIYTDGSYQPPEKAAAQSTTWAFSVWFLDACEARYHGHAAYGATPPDTPYHLGEVTDDVGTAEQLGLAWALVWALDRGVTYQVPICFAFDCMSAGMGAFGLSKQPGTDSAHRTTTLSMLITSLRHAVDALVPVVPMHVRSHTGVLGNEVVDVLAKDASMSHQDFYQRCLPLWPARLAAHPLCAWSWRLFDSQSDLPTLFALPAEAARLQQELQRVVPPTVGEPLPSRSQQATQCLDVRVMTYNVLTLLEPKSGHLDRHVGAASTSSAADPHADGVPPATGMRLYGKRDLLKATA